MAYMSFLFFLPKSTLDSIFLLFLMILVCQNVDTILVLSVTCTHTYTILYVQNTAHNVLLVISASDVFTDKLNHDCSCSYAYLFADLM